MLTYCTKRCRGKEEGKEALYRKRKVLHLVSQWSSLYKDFLREEEHVKLFMKVNFKLQMTFHVKKLACAVKRDWSVPAQTWISKPLSFSVKTSTFPFEVMAHMWWGWYQAKLQDEIQAGNDGKDRIRIVQAEDLQI